MTSENAASSPPTASVLRVVSGIVCEEHEATDRILCPACQSNKPGQEMLYRCDGCVTCGGKGTIPINRSMVTVYECEPPAERPSEVTKRTDWTEEGQA